ncbi:UDP-N-acetylmuramate dehydrogenase [Peptostreptococcus porci]|uniref:UDP-N-acetylmuramate dehydrogenase n=1 Tax=Peptostreptococcus porci TaxID=2652282 RepID=UPI0023F38397|nr:UDP-N-acetylmuramate dehydrogenase [Peptostreptococcus porci]MDD7182318.1 UDP-N-acetylmuramate dehydrogenase [Peptostreptococcus porci]MDY5964001.1 UDP-N-acetylmuramate dehydrogenase [Peptostreptococcus porci]MDY6231614.1 UDP-N-acetylmuramate dehydrogenase [Peptostreptococcus porci]
MTKNELYGMLKDIIDENSIFIDESMKKHISFKVGGPADVLVRPKTEDEIKDIFSFLNDNNIPFLVKGNGSNILIKDGGFRGVVIEIADNFSSFEIVGDDMIIQTGALLSSIGRAAMENNLTGFEFASGIPGTLGGALAMNAGAYGGEMKNIVKSVRLMDEKGKIVEFTNEEMEFGYRHSILSDRKMIAISAVISLKNGKFDEIKEKMEDLAYQRRTKQPLEYPSAGSTFKRPDGYFAGKLIQDSNLKGASMGGAMVSEKHSGFVINYNNATATDIINLIEHIKSTVYDQQGVRLEEEVKILGED